MVFIAKKNIHLKSYSYETVNIVNIQNRSVTVIFKDGNVASICREELFANNYSVKEKCELKEKLYQKKARLCFLDSLIAMWGTICICIDLYSCSIDMDIAFIKFISIAIIVFLYVVNKRNVVQLEKYLVQ